MQDKGDPRAVHACFIHAPAMPALGADNAFIALASKIFHSASFAWWKNAGSSFGSLLIVCTASHAFASRCSTSIDSKFTIGLERFLPALRCGRNDDPW